MRTMLPVILMIIPSVPLSAQTAAPAASPELRELSGCRTIGDPAARLSCFDAAAARLETALSGNALVVVTKDQVTRARRSVFGFSSSDPLPLTAERAELPDVFEGKVTALGQARGGKWVVQVDDTVWQATEVSPFQRDPTIGEAVTIRRGLLGSYKLSVAGRSGVRVMRTK